MSLYGLREVKRTYGGRTVLDIAELEFGGDMIYSLLGPNGSGKTTLLEILALLQPPTAGSVLYRDHKIDFAAGHLHALRREIVMVEQNPVLFTTTVYRNLETLSEAGIIGKLEISGRQKRFDFDVHPHDHIFCLQCHRVDNIDFDRTLVNPAAVASDKGYRITGYRVEFKGICANCRSNQHQIEDGENP